MEDAQYEFLFLRLSELERVREISREDGDPAELLGKIRDVLGVTTPAEVKDEHTESAAA